jgi:hypothetical protein
MRSGLDSMHNVLLEAKDGAHHARVVEGIFKTGMRFEMKLLTTADLRRGEWCRITDREGKVAECVATAATPNEDGILLELRCTAIAPVAPVKTSPGNEQQGEASGN